MASSSPTIKSQYQHFVPRFMLRNFGEAVQTPPRRGRNRRGRRQDQKDFIINVIDIKDATIRQNSISREFGLVDMYRDPGLENEHELEMKLSKLESAASRTIAKAVDTFSSSINNEAILSLTRSERDTLRKFLFLMKYRNSKFYQRYNHQDIGAYDANDKENMKLYLEKGNFKTPKDVWYANLRAFIDLQMDAARNWVPRLLDLVYPDDAKMFIYHVQQCYMAFCKPSSDSQEFFLPDNAYGIFEGPDIQIFDPNTGKFNQSTYTEYHNFAPISPKLLIILRSDLLATNLGDGSQGIQELYYETSRNFYPNPDGVYSILEDLPIQKCQNSYSEIRDGKLVFNQDSTQLTLKDVFFFRCFQLPRKHVDIINTIFLDRGVGALSIAFKSKAAALRAIEEYLTTIRYGFKLVTDQPDDPCLCYLRKLEAVVKQLGGKAKAKYTIWAAPKPEVHMSGWVGMIVGAHIFATESLMEVYRILRPGSSTKGFVNDQVQASRMLFLKIKTDVILSRSTLTLAKRAETKKCVADFLMTFPPPRLWLYIKFAKNLGNIDTRDFKKQIRPLELEGPEDMIARGVSFHI
ncbi:hypothetical protein AJ80_00554 [Polytolypa hystricis UAMH7299]|uniref:DUF4238 domain-containing protein n=1 Tax=Polytolypa hystricis (strain UAMH7299) TaxID=1447883 RepID=A0A2B7Z1F9_POLH7|nr:hypothetical protein AJ80_00554 [Polytolypa hystricis UAMH7299]